MNVKDKVVMITGAARGIGRTAVQLFLAAGAKVAMCDINEEQLQATRGDLDPEGARPLLAVPLNVADRASVDAAVKTVTAAWGRIDVLVNNAGITRDAMLHKLAEEDFDRVISVNLKGVFNCTQAVVPVMSAQKSGAIINTSSIVGVYGNVGQTNYAAAKAGLIGMTKTWAKELGRHGITVNAVAPGFTMTEMLATVPEKVLDGVRNNTPLKRLGAPEDIGNAYLFLGSKEASFITGQVLGVDGGLVL
ncbi:MAG: 3-oxoacyl-ACP reductase FabG [Elusimicrobia bacterium]|nr:3-oxoacyl-ACP reductase FabG [Elusimicrobiota bacterium]